MRETEREEYDVRAQEEARVGARVAVRRIHKIEARRGMVGTVVGCYGGDTYGALDVRFSDGAQRLFWPQDLEERPPET